MLVLVFAIVVLPLCLLAVLHSNYQADFHQTKGFSMDLSAAWLTLT